MKNKRTLFHIVKREALPWYQAWMIRGAAILLALVMCSLVTVMVTGLNPLDLYKTMFYGAFGTERKTWVLFQKLAILLGISLAVTPAFKMRFWNIGAEGQVMAGALACATVMITLGNTITSNWLMLLIMLVVSVAAGALWGFLPAFFKAHWNTNETLFTLMMNYIAIQLAAYFIIIWEVPKGSGKIGMINQNTHIGWLPYIGGKQYAIIIILIAILTVLLHIYLKYSKQGYEIAVVGESERTARYAGIKVEWVIIRTMVLSGALCGFIGMLLAGGTDHTLSTDLVGGRGFTAVMVSWLAKFNPIVMILTSFLLVFLQLGAKEVATSFYLNESFSEILTGIILFFIIGCEFFITYKIQFAKSSKEA
jgi:simple sugar transport system permease protein